MPPVSQLNFSFFNKFEDKLDIKRNSSITFSFGYLLAKNVESIITYTISYNAKGEKLQASQFSTKLSF